MKKLSAILMDLTEQVLAQSMEQTSGTGFHAALLLAQVAWNRAIDRDAADTSGNYLDLLARFERDNPNTRADLKSYECGRNHQGYLKLLREITREPTIASPIISCRKNVLGTHCI